MQDAGCKMQDEAQGSGDNDRNRYRNRYRYREMDATHLGFRYR
jgi:hypothetical protein